MTINKISERANILLNKEEGFDVDYKRNLKGLSVDDLVAFANSSKGGAILVGVDESINENGQQIGKVVGCTIGDKEKLSILNKASDCQPSVDIEIHVENEGELPFYRIEIPSGEHKPYSTFKGTYLIRGDGRNLPLNRSRLLNIFLQEQSETFLSRFKKATEELESHIVNLDKRIKETNAKVDMFEHNIIDLQEGLGADIQEITSNVNDLTNKTAFELNNIFLGIKSTEDLAEKTLNTSLNTIENVEKRISKIENDIHQNNLMTKIILEHLDLK